MALRLGSGSVVRIMVRVVVSIKQGCSFGLERLGLEAVSRRFLGRLGLVLHGLEG